MPFRHLCSALRGTGPVGLCFFPIWAWAQAQTPIAPPSSTLIKQDVNEVTLDVVIRDKHRHPIRDLTAGDVQITDDGKAVTLKSFRLASPGSTSNDLRVVTLLLDPNQPDAGRGAYDAAAYLIKNLAGFKTYYSAWQIGNHLTRISDFTANTTRFQESLWSATAGASIHEKNAKKARSGPAPAQPPAPDSGSDPLPAALVGISSGVPTAAQNNAAQTHIRAWLASLSALVSAEAQVPGRKLILYFTMGLSSQEGTNDAFRSLISDANRIGASIYVVDVSGLSTKVSAEAAATLGQVNFPAANLASMTGAGYKPPIPTGPDRIFNAPLRGGQFDSIDSHPDFQRNGPLRDLAKDTGGAYISESSNVRESIGQIAEDLQTYYEAVYVPAAEPFDGHFRRVELSVDRPHVITQARSGYYWMPTADGLKVAAFEIPLIKALDGEAHANSIPLTGQILRFGSDGSKTTAALAMQFPFKSLQPEEDVNEKLIRFHFAVLGLIRTPDGKVLQKISEDVPYETAVERKSAVQTQAFTFERYFAAPPGDYWAELAVEDRNANVISTQTLPFSIEAPKSNLRLSDIALLTGVEPAQKEAVDGDPLRYGDQIVKIDPASKIDEAPTKKLPIFLTVYPDASLKSPPKLEIEIRSGDQLLGKFKASIDQAANTQAKSYLASLPEASLESGHYVLIARAIQGDLTAERRREFDYVGDPVTAKADEPTHLLVSPMPKLLTGIERPDDREISTILSGARDRAVEFQTGLPNFLCLLVTKRFYDKTGQENWKQHDSITELVRYASGKEEYSTLEVNGERVTADRTKIGGVQANGVFGQFLHAVFSTEAGADFKWTGQTLVDGTPVHVFKYSVTQRRSNYQLRSEDGTKLATVGFHGLVYIDPNTLTVRRVSVAAENIPKDFSWRESTIDVDYDYVTVGEQKYLLPLSATLKIRRGKKMFFKNDMQFREYRRYTASSRILPN